MPELTILQGYCRHNPLHVYSKNVTHIYGAGPKRMVLCSNPHRMSLHTNALSFPIDVKGFTELTYQSATNVFWLHHEQYVSYIDVSIRMCDVSIRVRQEEDSFFKGYLIKNRECEKIR